MHRHDYVGIVSRTYGFDHAWATSRSDLKSHFWSINHSKHIYKVLYVKDDLQFRSVNGGVDSADIVAQIFSSGLNGDCARLQTVAPTSTNLNACDIGAVASKQGGRFDDTCKLFGLDYSAGRMLFRDNLAVVGKVPLDQT